MRKCGGLKAAGPRRVQSDTGARGSAEGTRTVPVNQAGGDTVHGDTVDGDTAATAEGLRCFCSRSPASVCQVVGSQRKDVLL
ncbi:hypothetical protein JOB18_003412 [Solea senegalensis]|uniref:Uncharacterized protein n=1 Tax=Solea senegalensis TaxID=28829 RepID=A0AAV6RM89_SOLSE|nr:hypothetical protein JOB18_003412 [Solea senegalensis]